MKKYILLALVMCRCVLVLGVEAPKKSTDANIFGHVVDRDTHEHIPYATIAVTGTAFGTTTDASGHYFLKNLPEGALTLEVRALGYASQTQQVTLRRGQTAELNFEVVQSGISMDEVVVSASRSARLRREAPALVGVLGLCLPLAGVAIAYAVIYYMALYDIFRSLDPNNCVLFLVLSIVFSVTEPFFLFFNRNKDGGMPPRRPEPVCMPPEPDWCDNSQDTGNTDFL